MLSRGVQRSSFTYPLSLATFRFFFNFRQHLSLNYLPFPLFYVYFPQRSIFFFYLFFVLNAPESNKYISFVFLCPDFTSQHRTAILKNISSQQPRPEARLQEITNAYPRREVDKWAQVERKTLGTFWCSSVYHEGGYHRCFPSTAATQRSKRYKMVHTPQIDSLYFKLICFEQSLSLFITHTSFLLSLSFSRFFALPVAKLLAEIYLFT